MAEVRPSRSEPVFWGLFTAGGTVAAFLFPVHIAIFGIALAAGWLRAGALSYGRVSAFVHHPLTRIYLGALIVLPLFHAAHRIRFTVHHELGVHGGKRIVAFLCYGSAAAGTALTVVALLRVSR